MVAKPPTDLPTKSTVVIEAAAVPDWVHVFRASVIKLIRMN